MRLQLRLRRRKLRNELHVIDSDGELTRQRLKRRQALARQRVGLVALQIEHTHHAGLAHQQRHRHLRARFGQQRVGQENVAVAGVRHNHGVSVGGRHTVNRAGTNEQAMAAPYQLGTDQTGTGTQGQRALSFVDEVNLGVVEVEAIANQLHGANQQLVEVTNLGNHSADIGSQRQVSRTLFDAPFQKSLRFGKLLVGRFNAARRLINTAHGQIQQRCHRQC